MTSSLDMIRGRSNIVTLTNNSGGPLIAGDVCIQDTSADENVTTTTSANSTSKVFVAAEAIASAASGRFYESGYCPFVNVNASVTRGHYLFTYTVAKQAAGSATYGAGAFGRVIKAGTSPSVIIYGATAQVSGSNATQIQGVNVSATTPTTNQVLKYDSSYWVPSAAGGGSGVTTYTDAFGSPPASPNAGDLWYPSDGLLALRYSGSAWLPIAPLFPKFTLPVIGDFAWLNQGSCTATDYGGLELYHPEGESGAHTRAFLKANPTRPYTIDIAVRLITGNLNYHSLGFCWSDETGFIIAGLENVNGDLIIYKFASITSGDSGSYATIPYFGKRFGSDVLFLRLQEDTTNRTVSASGDGRRYFQVHQVGRTDFLTATKVGFGIHSEEAVQPDVIHVLSWKES